MFLAVPLDMDFKTFLLIILIWFLECAKHCSICYNETECYECTQGYFLTDEGECESKYTQTHTIHTYMYILCKREMWKHKIYCDYKCTHSFYLDEYGM